MLLVQQAFLTSDIGFMMLLGQSNMTKLLRLKKVLLDQHFLRVSSDGQVNLGSWTKKCS